MSASPKQLEKDTNDIIAAWEKLAANASFAGLTLAQFKLKVGPSMDYRKQINDNGVARKSLLDKRDDADRITKLTNGLVVKAVVGDVNYGDNSDLYEAMGYVRKTERKSGLTKKKKNPPSK